MVYICSTLSLFVGIILLYSGDDAATPAYKEVGEVLFRNVSCKRAEVFRFL